MRASVREIIEFVENKASINAEMPLSNHSAKEGVLIHQAIQEERKKEYGASYQSEVRLIETLPLSTGELLIEGRIDGVLETADQVIVEEIKTSEPTFQYVSKEKLNRYYGQAKFYAYLLAKKRELEEITVRLIYVSTTEKTRTEEEQVYSIEELQAFFTRVTSEFIQWVEFEISWRSRRQQSLKELTFPYPAFRTGQRAFAKAVYQTLKEEKKLYTQAPTGTGKTISTLFPALKVMAEDTMDRIFYFTAKTITRTVAEEAVQQLLQKNARFKQVTLTAKEKLCFMEEVNCTPEYCPYALEYFGKRKEAMWEMLHQEEQYTRKVIESYAKKHVVCPFELSLDMATKSDVIIGDYNYLLNPRVSLERFFETEKTNSVFLFDEAHNLINRSCEMYSKSLDLRKLQEICSLMKKKKTSVKILDKIIDFLEEIQEKMQEEQTSFQSQTELPDELLDLLTQQLFSMGRFFEKERKKEISLYSKEELKSIRESYFDLNAFVKISEYFDENFAVIFEEKDHSFLFRIKCFNASKIIQTTLGKGVGSVLFSASFTPFSYYQTLLGGSSTDYSFEIPSPFDRENLAILIDGSISTRYRDREKSIENLVEKLFTFASEKQGNYLVFFPSYHYMTRVFEQFVEKYGEVFEVRIQENQMNEVEREAFLETFEKTYEKSLVVFGVLGGIFSEGIDLEGKKLIGTAIVSVGLPQVSKELSLISSYYTTTFQKGFAYASQIPGLNKVIQAGGRVIRSAEDVGVIYLIDERFTQQEYLALFPTHWFPNKVIFSQEELRNSLHDFWQSKNL